MIRKLQYLKELIHHLKVNQALPEDALFYVNFILEAMEAGVKNRRTAREVAEIIKTGVERILDESNEHIYRTK